MAARWHQQETLRRRLQKPGNKINGTEDKAPDGEEIDAEP
jgi:hypothetical protein